MEKLEKKEPIIISLVIPVYNAGKYILECLSSIQKQIFTDFEVIIINDGSSDNSKEIIEKFIVGDSRFILVHQENMGASAARNNGIKLARGEWLGFVDADDIISEQYLEGLYKATQKQDSVDWVQIPNVYEFYNSHKEKLNKWHIPKLSSNDDLFFRHKYTVYIWGKLYRTSLLKKFSIYFNQQLHILEDFVFNINFWDKAREVGYANSGEYNYRLSHGSLSRGVKEDKILSRIKACEYIMKMKSNHSKLTDEIIDYFYVNHGVVGTLRYLIKGKGYNYLNSFINYIDISKIQFKDIDLLITFKSRLLFILLFLLINLNKLFSKN